jgi:hypothetical protein
MRYEVKEDIENDCLMVEDTKAVITNSFGSEQLMLTPIEDALPLVERLQFLECYCKSLEEALTYGSDEWTDKDFRDTREEVELNMDD